MSDEICPYCGQGITKTQLEKITKRIEREAKAKFENKLFELQDLIHGKDEQIKTINLQNSETLDRILTDNSHKINELTKTHEELIENLRNEKNEEKLHLVRLQKDFDNLNDKFRKHQSELIGEIGEIQLLETLSETFIADVFNTQSRGTSEADIVQTVYFDNKPLDIRICYDNKQKTMVTKAHVDKAKKYQQIHNTKYVFIVSSILPKKDIPNSLFGIKEGIFLVHPTVTIEIVKLVRENLIAIHTKNTSQENRDSKETKLYDFITGHQFALKLSVISNCYNKLDTLLKSEITSHNRNWKQRRKSLDELFRAKVDLEQEVSIITDKTIEEVKIPLEDVAKIED